MRVQGCSWATQQRQDPGDPGGQWKQRSNLPSLLEITWALEPLVLDSHPLPRFILKGTEGESLGPVFMRISLSADLQSSLCSEPVYPLVPKVLDKPASFG